MFISVTRLRIRSPRFMLPFYWHSFTSSRQIERAVGFLDGKLGIDAKKTFWTITAWETEQAMRSYRNTDAHGRVMPKLLNWCDEASVVHWSQENGDLPDWQEAHRRMTMAGRMSKVKNPSSAQAAKQIAEPKIDKAVQVLTPAKHKK